MNVANQVLSIHKIRARCFSLSGVRPVSIRDQLLRSTIIVDALADERFIGPDQPLLVYGGGIAGINAAMRAVEEHGVQVTIIEKEKRLFSSIFASFRRIHLSEYDWPRPEHIAYPPQHDIPLMPPIDEPMTGMALATVLEEQFDNLVQATSDASGKSPVDLLTADADDFPVRPRHSDLAVKGPWPEGAGTTRHYGAVLNCLGPGTEDVALGRARGGAPGYAGPSYWRDNDGLRDPGQLPRGVSSIMISGGGDGAMQDFQRAATGHVGRALLDRIQHAGQARMPFADADIDGFMPDQQLQNEFMSADDRGRRACCWLPKDMLPAAFMQWSAAFERPINELVYRKRDFHNARVVAESIFRPQLLDGALSIAWIVKEPHFGAAYGLNRYLCLLLLGLAGRVLGHHKNVKLLYHTRIEAIHSDGSHPCGNIAECIGKPHRIDLRTNAPDPFGLPPQGSGGGTDGRAWTTTADLVILRHGLHHAASRRSFKNKLLTALPPVPQQIVPYDLPAFQPPSSSAVPLAMAPHGSMH